MNGQGLPRIHDSEKVAQALPLAFPIPGTWRVVMSCPDSGADGNAMTVDLANELGLKIEQSPLNNRKKFILANGKIIEAIGQTTSLYRFHVDGVQNSCDFWVFKTLATPLLMGRKFLQQTKTLTRHRSRLVQCERSHLQAFQLRALGKPNIRIKCVLNGKKVLALPDTGSELDVMSQRYAAARSLRIDSSRVEEVMYADGSKGRTDGVVHAHTNVVGDASNSILTKFHVLEMPSYPLLLGRDALNSFEVFTKHASKVKMDNMDKSSSSLNRLIHMGQVEQRLWNATKKIKKKIHDCVLACSRLINTSGSASNGKRFLFKTT